MTAKKIITIIVTVVLGIGLLVALFVGGIVLFLFQKVGSSDAAAVARQFLKENERLKQDIGEVKDFGWFITGNINIQNSSGTATLNLSVIGERKKVNATVDLSYRSGKQWRVTSATYKDEAGKTIELFNPYDSNLRLPEASDSNENSNLRSEISDRQFQISNPESQIRKRGFQISNSWSGNGWLL